ncbi:hypothetical protein ACFU53_11995 [Streptomyces sp. NPDC057474]|uniref:hypothetical protein n=1 Tax=Streptomyces sp. NPDC057474 TaxID=3346144 RepID=UPI00368C2918
MARNAFGKYLLTLSVGWEILQKLPTDDHALRWGKTVAGGNDPHARELARQARERERTRKAAEAAAKRKAREEKLAHEAVRAQEAVDKTSVAENDAEQLSKLLRTAVLEGQPLTFDRLKQEFVPSLFVPPEGRTKAAPVPRWTEYEPEAPRGLLGALGFGRRAYDAEVEGARERFDRALRDHARDEKKRAERMEEARALHEERNQEEAARVEAWNTSLEQRRSAYLDNLRSSAPNRRRA